MANSITKSIVESYNFFLIEGKKNMLLIIILIVLGCQENLNDLKFEINYLKGLELSSKTDKPVFLHFTGYACMAYNEFENDLIISKEIRNKLNEEFVTIQLYVDDRRLIETKDTLNLYKLNFSEEGQRRIKKATKKGHINGAIQIEKFNTNAQPFYVILDEKGNKLIEPFGYTSKNRKYFLAQLKSGLKAYKNKH